MKFLLKSTWIQGKIINEAFPRDEGDFLHHGGAAAEAELLQLQQGVDEAATAVQGLSGEKKKKKNHNSRGSCCSKPSSSAGLVLVFCSPCPAI